MRRFLYILGALGAAVLLAVATLPWWWGAVLRHEASRYGVNIGGYSRVGYARWAVTDVEWSNAAGRLTAKRVELPHPLVLAWRGADAGPGEIAGWSWVGAKSEPSAQKEKSENGWRKMFAGIEQTMPHVRRWVPRAEARHGEVLVSGQAIKVGSLVWDPASMTLKADAVSDAERELSAELQWSTTAEPILTGKVAAGDDSLNMVARVDAVDLKGRWWGQAWTGDAAFAAVGWIPSRAAFDATDLVVSGERVGLGAQYADLTGDIGGTWDGQLWTLNVRAAGEPHAGGDVPPLQIVAQAEGDRNQLTVKRLAIQAPDVNATLSAPFTWARASGRAGLNQQATFTIKADLAALKVANVTGKLSGDIRLLPQAEGWPAVHGDVDVDGLRWRDWPEVTAQVRADYVEGVVDVAELNAKADDGSRVQLSGAWNVATRTAESVEAQGRIARRWLERWLPEKLGFEVVTWSGEAEGTWPELQHHGELSVDALTFDPVRPSSWQATWKGVGIDAVTIDLTGATEQGRLALQGEIDATGVNLTEGRLTRADGQTLQLTKPGRISWGKRWRIEELAWAGPDDRLSLHGGNEGAWVLKAGRLEQAWVDDWVVLPGPKWFIDTLDVEGMIGAEGWAGTVDVAAAFGLGPQRSAQVYLETTWSSDGVTITRGEVSEGGNPILNLAGSLPVRIVPRHEAGVVAFDETAPIEITVKTQPNPAFWTQVDAALGVRVDAPSVEAALRGSWAQPTGEASLSAARVAADPARWGDRHLPELTGLSARLAGASGGLELQEFSAKISGQDVRASGRLPFDREGLEALRENPLRYLQGSGTASIEIPDADLSAWATLAPQILAPTGRLSLSLQVAPGAELTGSIRLDGAATRPLGPLGALQDVSARLSFSGRRLKIDEVKAQTGGRPVVLQGEATWPREGDLNLNLTLSGQNMPLVRQTGLLLRGDIDLSVRTEADNITWVRGSVKLRDGLFLVDLESLRPTGGGRAAAPARRPPYFSVEAKPFADWRLDLAVSGNRFMRIETPVFSGRASADFRLSGNLREPRAVGEATVPEGRVKLPFATFDVSEAWVRLTESQPFEPQLSLIGTARRLGYDLRLEGSGAASNPNLQFFSSPPLASEEVLLLVMAGEAPQDEVNYSSSQRATKLGAYLGQSLINQFTGNEAGEDRLTISTGENVSREGRETYRVEYELNRRWSVVGEYDEFDDFNAGVKWKIFSPAAKEAHESR